MVNGNSVHGNAPWGEKIAKHGGSSVANHISEFVFIGILLAVFLAVLTGLSTGLTGPAGNVIDAFITAISSNTTLIGVVFLVIVAVWVMSYVKSLQHQTK